ncbi:MAG: helix-turn-helix domain-containing protein [Oscillospiraceae bacterium]
MKIDEVPDMATIKETAEIFKLPEYFVRQLVKSGKVIAIKSGRKIFVNVEKFAELLNTNVVNADEDQNELSFGIKPIKE